MKEKITTFIDGLIIYDYIFFGSVFLLFILFFIITILLRKRIVLAIFFLFLSITILTVGSIVGYIQMHKYLFKNKTVLISQKKLTFTKAIVVKGTITNESKFHFDSCKITANVYKVSSNPIKNFLFPFNPFKKMSILQEDIEKNQTKKFKIIVEPFTYSKDYNISLESECR